VALEMNDRRIDAKVISPIDSLDGDCGVSMVNHSSAPPRERAMTESDVGPVLEFWHSIEGLILQEEWDDAYTLRRFLLRNAGFSRIVVDSNDGIIGTLLCGHDGCRGYLHNLAVHPDHRCKGWGNLLVRSAIQALRGAEIRHCHTYIHGSDLLRSLTFLSTTEGRLRNDLPLLTLKLLPGRQIS
jgi:putative acetyltransferase